MFSSCPPPLAPMSAVRNDSAKHGCSLGAALASLKSRDSGTRGQHQAIGLDEPVEAGVGVGHFQDNEDECLSVQQHEAYTKKRNTSRPKRASLIDRSKEFKEKLVQFMQDYDDGTLAGDYDDVGLEESNRFPTREVDLRHVDQGINLMDASSARHSWREDEEAAEYPSILGDGDRYVDEPDDDDDDDVYANYTQGYTSPKHHEDDSSIPGCGGVKIAIENANKKESTTKDESFKISFTKNRGSYSNKCCSLWLFVVFVGLSLLLVASDTMMRGSGNSNTVSTHPPAPLETFPPLVQAPRPNGNPASHVEHRRLVLDHVIRETLLGAAHSAELDPQHPAAQTTITWMTTYDEKSIRLLDNFNYHTSATKDIDDPANHANLILDRYVETVFYFKAHPRETAKSNGLRK